MCKATGKLFADYARLNSTKEFFQELSSVTGISGTELVISVSGGDPQLQGTWVHPDVAINLGQWCSPKFAVAVSQWVREWLSRIDKDSKEARNKRIADLWLASNTNQQIADIVGIPKGTVDGICLEMAELPESSKPVANHLTDFTPPIYNIWKQQEKTSGVSHFGNSEVRWVDNLLYLYTVIDAVLAVPPYRWKWLENISVFRVWRKPYPIEKSGKIFQVYPS